MLIASCVADDSPMSLVPVADARDLADRYRAGGTPVRYQPADCSMTRFVTDIYGWGTDLQFIGDMFIRLIQMSIVPLVMASVIVATGSMTGE